MSLAYVCITPARDEAENLPRLAGCLARQTLPPHAWIVVDNGSRDGTPELVGRLAAAHSWVRLVQIPGDPTPVRGAPIVRALHAGIAAIDARPDLVVNLDADVDFEPDFFARLAACFVREPRLGIASGTCLELDDGHWRQRHVTGTTVWGATRAWRRECLEQVLPLEERLGWDGIDEFKANSLGWTTRTVTDLPFRHHRREGQRDSGGIARWRESGRTARYVGYRPWYLALRAFFQATRDVTALACLWGYADSALRHEPRCADPRVVEYVRSQQNPRQLSARVQEALGRRPSP